MAVKDEATLSFRVEPLAAHVAEGREAYREFFQAITAPEFVVAVRSGEYADALRQLPSPDEPLGLRELVLLGGETLAGGLLEAFASEATSLQDWIERTPLLGLFPEYRKDLPLSELHPSAVVTTRTVVTRADQVALFVAMPPGATAILFVLVRDFLVDIAPVLERLAVDSDWLIRVVFEELQATLPTTGPWLGRAERIESASEPVRLFAALLLERATPVAKRLADEIGEERILAAAREAAPPPPEPGALNLQPRVVPDLPSAEDLIGVAPLVDGLEALLNDPKTTLPLAVAINAPWGAGKSSVMLQLRQRLERGEGRAWQGVSFDAWKYEKSERLWAALAKAVYDQPLDQMAPSQRFRFRWKLERKRLGRIGFWGRTIAPILVAAAVVVVVIATGAGGTPTAATVTTLATILGVGQAARLLGLIADPFKRALDQYAARGAKYDAKLGFTAEADADIAILTRLLTGEDGRALAIFVDDLDRCSPAHVVEVVEAINQIFNSAAGRPCLFILGMDRDVVAASIEAAYGDLIGALRLRNPDLAADFGERFLAKLVQLSVTVPAPSDAGMKRLLSHVTGNPAPAGSADGDSAPVPEDVDAARKLIEAERPTTPVGVAEAAQTVRADVPAAAVEEAVRQARAKRFNADSADVAAAEFELLQHLPRNPRDVKRFDNAFRLQLHVANGTPGCGLRFTPDELFALGKWVAVRLRWPEVARQFDERPELIAAVEHACNGGPAEVDGFVWPDDRPALERLLRETSPSRRIEPLPFPTFLRAL